MKKSRLALSVAICGLLAAACSSPEYAPPPPAPVEDEPTRGPSEQHYGDRDSTDKQDDASDPDVGLDMPTPPLEAEEYPSDISPTMPDEAFGDDEETGFEDVANLEVVTDFLAADADFRPKAGELPVGLVLFDRNEELKNAILCDAYTKELRTHAEAKAASPEQDFFVTYWMLKETPADWESCDALRAAYDYDRAAAIKAEYGLSGTSGPVFLAVDSAGDSVFLDLSNADLATARSAVEKWLVLALESSEEGDAETIDPETGEENTSTTPSRFTLASFSASVRDRVISGQGVTSQSQMANGATLFAYADTSSGVRMGTTIRF